MSLRGNSLKIHDKVISERQNSSGRTYGDKGFIAMPILHEARCLLKSGIVRSRPIPASTCYILEDDFKTRVFNALMKTQGIMLLLEHSFSQELFDLYQERIWAYSPN
jgi:hypothetical protein